MDRRSGVFCRTAEMAYDPKSCALKLANKKSASAHVALPGIRRSGEAAFFQLIKYTVTPSGMLPGGFSIVASAQIRKLLLKTVK